MTEQEQYHFDLNKQRVEEALNTPYPEDTFSGKGIVTCGGSEKYFVPAVIMIKMLRYLGCTLPVQIWYLGEEEMTQNMRDIASELENVELVDACKIREEHPIRRLGGWECKVYAIMYSRFKEVLFIDSDNIPVRDPSYLFNTPLYKETGALFWPDLSRLTRSRKIWKICDVEYKDEPEFESGQMVIDKSRNWTPLLVAKHLNEYSDFYYQKKTMQGKGYIWGDKDTYHMAWRMTDHKYNIIPKKVKRILSTMLQYDGSDRLLFQHRNLAKFRLIGQNPRISGFLHEELCLNYLDELRDKWEFVSEDTPRRYEDNDIENVYRRLLSQKYFQYHRLGKDKRIIELTPDQKINKGKSVNENAWELVQEGPHIKLLFKGHNGPSSLLKYQYKGTWTGNSCKGTGRIQLRACKH